MAIATGRIVYIDPNELLEEKGININNGDNITWNPEDLSISVDLQVIIPNRDSCGINTETQNCLMNINGKMGSFFQGGNNGFLTTEYTDISYQEIKNNNAGGKETLGIQSIDINFDSHFFPIVKMKMIDVRGYTLMMPEQLGEEQRQEINNSKKNLNKLLSEGKITEDYYKNEIKNLNNIRTCESFFKALFHFPYPTFALSIKGYYGNRVTFKLAVNSFQSSFNSNTGNFEVEIEFIGYMYGIYSDLPFNFLILAPYFGKNGQQYNSYWQNNPAFVCSDGITRLPTFIDFMHQYEDYKTLIQEYFENNGSNAPNLTNIIEGNKAKKEISSLLNLYEDILENIGKETKTYQNSNDSFVITFCQNWQIDLPSVKKFKKAFEDFRNNSYYTEKIKEPDLSDFSTGDSSYYKILSVNDILVYGPVPPMVEGTFDKQSSIYKKLSESKSGQEILNNEDLVKKEEVIGKYCYLYKKDTDFINELCKLSQSITENVNDGLENSQKDIETLTENALGILPTIENVFRMIFAHIDTFMALYYNVLKNIKNDKKRNDYNNYKIDIDKTDIEVNGGNSGFLPPFPGFFDLDKNKNCVRKYPGEIENVSSIEEVNFIESIYEGLEALSDIVYTSSNNTTSDYNWTPLILSDFYLEQNPYKKSLEDIGGEDNILGYFLYQYLMRIKSYEITENIKDKINSTLIDNEIENLLMAQGSNLRTKKVKDKLLEIINNQYPAKLKEILIGYIDGKVNYFDFSTFKDYKDKIKLSNEISIDDFPLCIGETLNGISHYNIISSNDEYGRFSNSHVILEYNFLPKDNGIQSYSEKKQKYIEIPYSFENMAKIKEEDYKNYAFRLLREFETKKNNLFLDKDYITEQSETSGITKYEKALIFLSTMIGHTDFYRFDKDLSSILRMPKFIALFLGGIIWNYKNKEKVLIKNEYPYIIDIKGIYDKCGKGSRVPLTRVENLDLKSLVEEDEKSNNCIEKYFISWAEGTEEDSYPMLQSKLMNNYYNSEGNAINFDGIYFEYDSVFTYEAQISLMEFYTETVDFIHINKKDKNILTYNELKIFCEKLYNKIKDNIIEEDEINKNLYEENIDEVYEKQELYYSLKNFYDKWSGSIWEDKFKLKTPQEDKEISKKKMNGEIKQTNNISEFNNFIFIDNFYEDISDKLLISPKFIYDIIKSHVSGESNRSVLQVISDIAQKNHMNFIPLPVFNNFYDIEGIKDIFKPHNLYNEAPNSYSRGEGNTYLLMYNYSPSKNSSNQSDDLSVGYKKDDFVLSNDNKSLSNKAEELFSKKEGEIEYTVPAFNVSFSKQNQSYFKGLTLNMNNPRETNESIQNRFILADKNAEGAVKAGVTPAQNLFSVYTTRAYDCGVEMMGCADIIPTMYFQVQNVPIFKGTYLIYNVKHHIENGSMTTSFVGTKISSIKLPFVSNEMIMQNIYSILGIELSGDVSTYGEVAFTGKKWSSKQEFVREMRNIYTCEFNSRNIDLRYVDYIVGQDALESAWGTAGLCRYNNLGGIKAKSGEPYVVMKTTECNKKGYCKPCYQKFRIYETLQDYIKRKVNLLNGDSYKAFSYGPEHFYERVKAGGYATDPNYVSKLNEMYQSVIKIS